jgi:hypothetical protein
MDHPPPPPPPHHFSNGPPLNYAPGPQTMRELLLLACLHIFNQLLTVNFIYNKLSESHENYLQLLNKTQEKFKL